MLKGRDSNNRILGWILVNTSLCVVLILSEFLKCSVGSFTDKFSSLIFLKRLFAFVSENERWTEKMVTQFNNRGKEQPRNDQKESSTMAFFSPKVNIDEKNCKNAWQQPGDWTHTKLPKGIFFDDTKLIPCLSSGGVNATSGTIFWFSDDLFRVVSPNCLRVS